MNNTNHDSSFGAGYTVLLNKVRTLITRRKRVMAVGEEMNTESVTIPIPSLPVSLNSATIRPVSQPIIEERAVIPFFL